MKRETCTSFGNSKEKHGEYLLFVNEDHSLSNKADWPEHDVDSTQP